MDIISLFNDAQDAILPSANGELTISLYNRYSRLGELFIIDWITGDIAGQQPPEPYLTQKNKDWCAPFIEKITGQVAAGTFPRPKNYYGFENMYMLGQYGRKTNKCAEDEDKPYDVNYDLNTPIELLDGGQFTVRSKTYINGLQPSFTKPIAKVVGRNFEFLPKDLGSIGLEYYRYPKFGQIVPMIDQNFNEEVPDPNNSINYEWDENVRGMLLWFIVDRFSNRTSNQAMKQFNQASGKTPHG